jgi:hypothetical protein
VKLPRQLSEKLSLAAQSWIGCEMTFAVRILAEPASITGDDIGELRAHGWTDRIIAEVVGLVTLNLMTGAFNLVAGIRPEASE